MSWIDKKYLSNWPYLNKEGLFKCIYVWKIFQLFDEAKKYDAMGLWMVSAVKRVYWKNEKIMHVALKNPNVRKKETVWISGLDNFLENKV